MTPLRRSALALGLLLAVAGASPGAARAATPAPHFSLRMISLGSHFEAGTGSAESQKYEILATNTGAAATAGEPALISVALSPLLELRGEPFVTNWATGEEFTCTPAPIHCAITGPLAPDGTLVLILEVRGLAAAGIATSEASIAGGGAPPESVTTETPLGTEASPFAIQELGFSPTALDGGPDLQAAAHPYEQTTSFQLLSDPNNNAEELFRPAQNPRNLVFTLPDGFLGNPLAAPRCALKDLEDTSYGFNGEFFEFSTNCPKGSRIGNVTLLTGRSGGATGTLQRGLRTTAVYNLQPEAGHPAEFGFVYIEYAVVFYADLIHTAGGYRLRVSVPGVPNVGLDGSILTLFGNPGARNGETANTEPFFTNPSNCNSGPLSTRLEADSWEDPHHWISAEEVTYPQIEGCDRLAFNPELTLTPETTRADTPTGLEVDLRVPKAATPFSLLQSPPLRSATVALPKGLSVSPSVADGLQGCGATGPAGIDVPRGTLHPDEAGEGEAIGPSGLSQLASGNCPPASEIATATLTTPLIDHPLQGSVYVGDPECAPCTARDAEEGRLLKLYIEIDDPDHRHRRQAARHGLRRSRHRPAHRQLRRKPPAALRRPEARLPLGPAGAARHPRHLRALHDHRRPDALERARNPRRHPQLELRSQLRRRRRPLRQANPSCPTSRASKPAPPTDRRRLQPLRAEAEPRAGTQPIARIDTTLPPGLTGKLAGIPYCSEAQIAAAAQHSGRAEQATPSCPPASEVGTVDVGAGAGPALLRHRPRLPRRPLQGRPAEPGGHHPRRGRPLRPRHRRRQRTRSTSTPKPPRSTP